MTAQNRNRFLLLIASVLVAFVIVFFRADKVTSEVPDSTFMYRFSQPLYKADAEKSAVETELRKTLEDAGVELDYAHVVSPTEIKVATLALDEKEAAADREKVATALKKSEKFKEAQEMEAATKTEKPLFTLAGFHIYGPRPRVSLGLDLKGGSHLVLRCLPETELVFKREDDKPFVEAAEAAKKPEGAEEKTSEKATEKAEEKALLSLRASLETMLRKHKVEWRRLDVSSEAIAITTTAPDKATADKHAKLIEDFLKERYPDVYKARSNSTFIDQSTAETVKGIIDRRVNYLGVNEPLIQTQGRDRIIVELPGVKNPERAREILGSTAKLEFKLLPKKYNSWEALSPEEHTIPGFEGKWVWKNPQTEKVLSEEAILAGVEPKFTGGDLMPTCKVIPGSQGDWVVSFEMKGAVKTDFAKMTRAHVNDYLVILLDNKVVIPPKIRSALPGKGVIEGNFTADRANDLALLLNAGALPVGVEVAENRTISATLGKGSMEQSLRAGIIGFVLVLVFMAAYYRVPGLLADLALVIYALMVLAVLIAFRATLTLPGIAGIILSIGMAVDANIIIFERLKEELATEKTMRSAVEAAFTRAWTAILDGNVTTLIAAAVLFFLGASLIKGFAVTLFIGVCCSMVSAIVVTRLFMDIAVSTRLGENRKLFGAKPAAD